MKRLGLSEIIFRYRVRDLPVESWSAFFFVRHDYCTTGAGRNPTGEHTGCAPHPPLLPPTSSRRGGGGGALIALFPVDWGAPRAGARSPGWAGLGGSGSLGRGPKVRVHGWAAGPAARSPGWHSTGQSGGCPV